MRSTRDGAAFVVFGLDPSLVLGLTSITIYQDSRPKRQILAALVSAITDS